MPNKNEFAMTPTVIAGAAAMLPRKEMTIQDLWGLLARRRKSCWHLPAHDRGRCEPFRDRDSALQGHGRDPGTKGIGRRSEHEHHDGS